MFMVHVVEFQGAHPMSQNAAILEDLATAAAANVNVAAATNRPRRATGPIRALDADSLTGARPEGLSTLMASHRSVDVKKMRAPDFLDAQDRIEKIKLAAIEAGSGWRAVDSCPLCGWQSRQPEFSKHGILLVCCDQCGVRYGAHVPANLDDVYKNPAYVSYSKEDSDDHYDYRRERFGRERVQLLERHCQTLRDKKLVDIGCGNGYFISVAKESCGQTFGTEFSDRLRTFAAKKTGLPIFSESLDQLPETGFDVVTMFDVIEHVPDPNLFIAAVDRILNPGGHLLIFTPNFDSFGIRVMGNRSSIIDPTEHIILYTLRSLRFLAARFGYQVVYTETAGLDVQNILAMNDSTGSDRPPFLTTWHNELQAMVNVANCGDYARILLRKPA
jgi:2-polyprenyl-3-methyl-5-hydroxy-6-metoxy-1,4-benzoquinol methylase